MESVYEAAYHILFIYIVYLSTFADLLKKSAPSRVINVSSGTAKSLWSLNLNKLNIFEKEWALYNKSKICVIYFTQELANRLEGTRVTTYSLHPGSVASEFFRERPFMSFLYKTFFLVSNFKKLNSKFEYIFSL